MITQRKLDDMQIKSKLHILEVYKRWKEKFESGPYTEVNPEQVQPPVEVNNASGS
jgi:hypothetical protein